MMTKYKNNKGVSLPLVIGLVLILMLASVAANEMIIRTLRSVSQIESADRAYFAAEAGIEDALYELSPHFAGYETPDIPTSRPADTDDARKDVFDSSLNWENRWEIGSHTTDTCDPVEWPDYELCGRIYENQKLAISSITTYLVINLGAGIR